MGDLRFVFAAIAVFAAAFVGMSFGMPGLEGFSVRLSTARRRSRTRLLLRPSRLRLPKRAPSPLWRSHRFPNL